MRIDSLHIEGFGVYRDARLEQIPPGLTIFQGPNESGKSTLLAFLRYMLFGFAGRRSKENRYPPAAPAAAGGCLNLWAGDGRYRLERYDNKPRILMPDGAQGGEAELQRLLGGVSRETFQTVFAFGLQELAQLHEAFEQGVLREALYGAAAGLDPQLVAGAESEIDGQMAALFKARIKKSAIPAALGALEQLQQEIRGTGEDLETFDKLGEEAGAVEQVLPGLQTRLGEVQSGIKRLEDRAEWEERLEKSRASLANVEEELERLRADRGAIRMDGALLGQAAAIRELLQGRDRLADLRAQGPALQQSLEALRRDLGPLLDRLGPEWSAERIAGYTAVGDAAALDALAGEQHAADLGVAEARATERAAMEEREAASEAAKQASAAFESLPEPPPACDAGRLEHLMSGRGDYEHTGGDVRKREGELRAAEEELGRALAEIDPRWKAEDLDRFDTSLAAQERMRRAREGLVEAQKAAERAREQAAQAEARHAQARGRLGAAPDAAPGDAASLRATVRRVQSGWENVSRGNAGVWIAAPAAAGAAAALWLVSAIAAAVAALVLVAGFWLQRRMWRRRRADLEAEFRALCRGLGVEYPLAANSFLELDRLIERHQDAAEAARELARMQADAAEADAAMQSAGRVWQSHLESLGFSATLSPEGAVAIVSRIEVGRARLKEVRSLRHRIDMMRQNRGDFLAVLNELLAARGQPAATHEDVGVRLPQFLESVRREAAQRQQRQQAREVWRGAAERRGRAEDALLEAARRHEQAIEGRRQRAAQVREWLERHSLPPHLSPAAARDFLLTLERARELLAGTQEADGKLRRMAEHERTELRRLHGIQTASGRNASADPIADLDALAAALRAAEQQAYDAGVLDARIGELERRAAAARGECEEAARRVEGLGQAGAALPELNGELGELRERIGQEQRRLGELRTRRNAMATDERLAVLHERKEARLEEIRHCARQWAVLALARRMLHSARERFEQQRQPEVVRRASEYLRRMAGGRYRQIRMPLDGSALQVLAEGDGHAKSVEQLSRGTAEQLYLALRFGFIEEFSREREALPIVMDDIMVNFDPRRAGAAMETVCEMAERYQVFYFTCHPETVERFRGVRGVPVVELSDGKFGGSVRTFLAADGR